MSRRPIFLRLLQAIASAVHAFAAALERMAGAPRRTEQNAAAMQALAERFPGAPEHWLQMIAEKAPQLAEAAPVSSEAEGERGPAPPPPQLSRRPRQDPPVEVPEPTLFGPVSATRPWLTGQASAVHLRAVAPEAPKLAPPPRPRPIGRALSVLARRRALAAAAARKPEAPPKADAAGDAFAAANTDEAAPKSADPEGRRPDTPAPAPSVAPETRSFRPTGPAWATPEPLTPSNDVAEPPPPTSRDEPPEAKSTPASDGAPPTLTAWPWRPHGRAGETRDPLPPTPVQARPPLALPAADLAPRSAHAGASEPLPPHERAHFAEPADDRWPELPAVEEEAQVEASASDVARHVREPEEGGWNA